MPSEKEISSTEKLLDVIRNDGKSGMIAGSDGTLRSKGGGNLSFSRDKSLKKTISVGIDIGGSEIKLVKVAKPSDNEWRLLDYRKVPLKGVNPDNIREMAGFLKKEVIKFSGSIRNSSFWALLSSAQAEVQQVRIPKVGKRQIENAVYWTAKKNFSFDEKEVAFDFDLQGEVTESGVAKQEVLVYTVPNKEIRQAESLFGSAGIPLAGLTIAPFAIQNIFKTNWIHTFGRTMSTLYIGREWSRIDIFSKGNLAVTRGIRTGVNSMIEALMVNFNEKRKNTLSNEFDPGPMPDSPDLTMDVSMNMDEARELLYGINSDSKSESGTRTRFGLERREIFDLIHPSLERLVRQIERTFEHYTVTLGNDKINTIYVSITADIYSLVLDFIGDQLGIEKDVLDPFDPQSPFVDQITSDTSIAERTSFAPALGLALSSLEHTPNLIFTYKDKEEQTRIKLVNRMIFSAFSLVMAVFIGTVLWFGYVADQKKTTIKNLENNLVKGILVDENTILPMVKKAKDEQMVLQEYVDRYMGLATIGELATLTPPNIRLISIKAKMGSVSAKMDKKDARVLILDGLVTGDTQSFEPSLAGYVLEFQNSMMFEGAKVYKSYNETRNNEKVLHFILNINLVKA